MRKLTDKNIRFICRHAVDKGDWTKQELAVQYGVTVRRIEQLIMEYRRTEEYPKPNPARRPKGPQLSDEEKIIDEVWEESRLGARLLYKELRKRGYKIAHNKIHRYLQETGRTVPYPKKQKKRRQCRYERKHTFSLVHGDWHRTSIHHPNSQSRFQRYLAQKGIRPIPSRKNNPQTNGKVERFWLEYDRHQWRFQTISEFIDWYNRRLHGALWVDIGENPSEAVFRKLQPESLLGLFLRWAK